jgi:hypothetical protein
MGLKDHAKARRRFPGGGLSRSIIDREEREFPSLADLAATYSSKP